MLVDRREALESLRHSLGLCHEGYGQLVLVNGGLASGKTALLQEFANTVGDSQVLFLTAACTYPERTLRMGVMSQLFHSARLPEDVVAEAGQLINAEMSRAANTNDHEEAADAFVVHGLCTILLDLSQKVPLVLSIDDVHHADSASLQVLLHLRRHIQSSPVMLLFSEWACPGEVETPLHAEVSRQPHRRITVNRLTPEGVRELLAAQVGGLGATRLAPAYYALSGGNPLLVNALVEDDRVREMNGAGRDAGKAPVVGAEYRRAVMDCLYRWDKRLLQVGRAIAVLGDTATPATIGRLLDMKTGMVRQMLDILGAAGLTTASRFRHPELATTVLENLSADTRAQLHTRAAELLYETGGQPIAIARHVVNSEAIPGPWAVRSLLQAADEAVSQEEIEIGMKGLELALRECEKPDRLSSRIALAHMAWRVNPSAIARHLPALREALTNGQPSGRIAAAVIRHLLWHGDLELVAKSLRMLPRRVDTALDRVVGELSQAHAWIYGTPIDTEASAAPGGGAQLPPPTLSAVWQQGPSEALVQSAEYVLQDRIIDTLPEVGAMAVLVLDHAGRPQRALQRYETLLDSAVRQGAITWQALLKAVRADIALRRGELPTAVEHADDALRLMHAQSWGVLIGFPVATLVSAHTAMGDHHKAAALLESTVPEAMFDTVFGMRYLHARGRHRRAVGRSLAAIDDFERCGALMRERDLDIPALVPWRTDLAEAHLRLGHTEKARELAAEQLALPAAAVDTRTRGISLRLLGSCGPSRKAVALLQKAIHVLEESGDHLELARALAELSWVQQSLGELDQARLVARRAEMEARFCHADVLAVLEPRRGCGGGGSAQARPRRRSACVTVTNSVMDSLSNAERKVASLAALGHTNREIGRELCITVSTVEQHLTRVYRKLNVNRRADLASRCFGLVDVYAG